jgi:hypothetical protein
VPRLGLDDAAGLVDLIEGLMGPWSGE